MRSIGVGIRLFFCSSDLMRGVHACLSVEAARRAQQTRAVVSLFQSHSWSFAFFARFARRIKKK